MKRSLRKRSYRKMQVQVVSFVTDTFAFWPSTFKLHLLSSIFDLCPWRRGAPQKDWHICCAVARLCCSSEESTVPQILIFSECGRLDQVNAKLFQNPETFPIPNPRSHSFLPFPPPLSYGPTQLAFWPDAIGLEHSQRCIEAAVAGYLCFRCVE